MHAFKNYWQDGERKINNPKGQPSWLSFWVIATVVLIYELKFQNITVLFKYLFHYESSRHFNIAEFAVNDDHGLIHGIVIGVNCIYL